MGHTRVCLWLCLRVCLSSPPCPKYARTLVVWRCVALPRGPLAWPSFVPSQHCMLHFCCGRRWIAIGNNPNDKVPITHPNVLQYAANSYEDVLLKNFTTRALGSHVLWTVRYLATAAQWDWGVLRRDFVATLIKKVMSVGQCLQALAAAGCTAPLSIVITVQELLQRWAAIAGQGAGYTEDTSPSAAVELRDWCLRLLAHVNTKHPGGIVINIKKKKRGAVGPDETQAITVHPKLCRLTPIHHKHAPFITLDNLWAARALGLKPADLLAHTADDPTEMYFEGEDEPLFIHHKTLEPFKPLPFLFGQSSTVKKWLRSSTGPVRTIPFPATIKTDGVQLHVPIKVERILPADVAASKGAPKKSNDPDALAAQLARPDGHGEFSERALADLVARHGLPPPGSDRPSTGVDPGLITVASASNNYEVSPKEFYKGRLQRRRRTFDPGGARDPNDFTNSGHSRRSRNNCAPQAVVAAEAALSADPPGATLATYVRHLAVYFKHEQSQRRWYGSRTQRAARFVRAGRTRAIFATITNGIAPDPRTVVMFGAYAGRGAMRGDTEGPSPLKALRRFIARTRIVIVTDEYNTTATHSACGAHLVPRLNDPTGREKYCPVCEEDVPRDLDAAYSMDSIWVGYVTLGQRPAHLRRHGQ